MERIIDWNQIKYQSENNLLPSKRWGHKTVIIDQQIVLFGGFSDLTYLSDLWAYNIHTNRWRQIKTQGKIPQGKSNFTMHYDTISNFLMIFGGGGPMKKRFNVVSFLNWQTKVWQQYDCKNQNSPWQRTYHSSQFKYPYLITFGGEGAAYLDFDDIWAFNIIQKEWINIKIQTQIFQIDSQGNIKKKKQKKIQARRFHTTAMIDYEFYVISGCRINYECISNIYSINLKSFFEKSFNKSSNQQNRQFNKVQIQNQKLFINKQSLNSLSQKKLFWKQYNLKANELQLIERWGHNAQIYQGKIYIFGGRNKQDLNNLVQFDPQRIEVRLISSQNAQNIPKPRRRHSSCRYGSSMIIFGGFNGQYYNDMHYISLFECRTKLRQKIKINSLIEQK